MQMTDLMKLAANRVLADAAIGRADQYRLAWARGVLRGYELLGRGQHGGLDTPEPPQARPADQWVDGAVDHSAADARRDAVCVGQGQG